MDAGGGLGGKNMDITVRHQTDQRVYDTEVARTSGVRVTNDHARPEHRDRKAGVHRGPDHALAFVLAPLVVVRVAGPRRQLVFAGKSR